MTTEYVADLGLLKKRLDDVAASASKLKAETMSTSKEMEEHNDLVKEATDEAIRYAKGMGLTKKGIQNFKNSVLESNQVVMKATNHYKDAAESIIKFNREMNQHSATIASIAKVQSDSNKKQKEGVKAQSDYSAAVGKGKISVEGMAIASNDLDRSLKQIATSGKLATDQISKSDTAMRKWVEHAQRLIRYYVLMQSVIKTTQFILSAIKIGGDFEKSMLTLQGVARSTAEELDPLRQVIRDLGADTEWTATQIADAARYLAMAGLKVEQISVALKPVVDLATAGNIGLRDAADISTNIMSGFGLAVEDLDRVNDVLIGTITRTNSTIIELYESMKYAAPIARSYGYEIEEVSAMLGILHNAGIKGSMAGTNLSRAIFTSSRAFAALSSESVSLLNVLGVDKMGLLDILDKIKNEAWSASKIIKVFGDRGARAALIFSIMGEEVKELTEKLIKSGGETQKLANMMRSSYNVQVERFKSIVEDIKIEFFEQNLGNLTVAVNKASDAMQTLKKSIIDFLTVIMITAPLTVAIALIGGLIIGGYKLAASFIASATAVGVLTAATVNFGIAYRALVTVMKAHPITAIIAGAAIVATAIAAIVTSRNKSIEQMAEEEKISKEVNDRLRERIGLLEKTGQLKKSSKDIIEEGGGESLSGMSISGHMASIREKELQISRERLKIESDVREEFEKQKISKDELIELEKKYNDATLKLDEQRRQIAEKWQKATLNGVRSMDAVLNALKEMDEIGFGGMTSDQAESLDKMSKDVEKYYSIVMPYSEKYLKSKLYLLRAESEAFADSLYDKKAATEVYYVSRLQILKDFHSKAASYEKDNMENSGSISRFSLSLSHYEKFLEAEHKLRVDRGMDEKSSLIVMKRSYDDYYNELISKLFDFSLKKKTIFDQMKNDESKFVDDMVKYLNSIGHISLKTSEMERGVQLELHDRMKNESKEKIGEKKKEIEVLKSLIYTEERYVKVTLENYNKYLARVKMSENAGERGQFQLPGPSDFGLNADQIKAIEDEVSIAGTMNDLIAKKNERITAQRVLVDELTVSLSRLIEIDKELQSSAPPKDHDDLISIMKQRDEVQKEFSRGMVTGDILSEGMEEKARKLVELNYRISIFNADSNKQKESYLNRLMEEWSIENDIFKLKQSIRNQELQTEIRGIERKDEVSLVGVDSGSDQWAAIKMKQAREIYNLESSHDRTTLGQLQARYNYEERIHSIKIAQISAQSRINGEMDNTVSNALRLLQTHSKDNPEVESILKQRAQEEVNTVIAGLKEAISRIKTELQMESPVFSGMADTIDTGGHDAEIKKLQVILGLVNKIRLEKEKERDYANIINNTSEEQLKHYLEQRKQLHGLNVTSKEYKKIKESILLDEYSIASVGKKGEELQKIYLDYLKKQLDLEYEIWEAQQKQNEEIEKMLKQEAVRAKDRKYELDDMRGLTGVFGIGFDERIRRANEDAKMKMGATDDEIEKQRIINELMENLHGIEVDRLKIQQDINKELVKAAANIAAMVIEGKSWESTMRAGLTTIGAIAGTAVGAYLGKGNPVAAQAGGAIGGAVGTAVGNKLFPERESDTELEKLLRGIAELTQSLKNFEEELSFAAKSIDEVSSEYNDYLEEIGQARLKAGHYKGMYEAEVAREMRDYGIVTSSDTYNYYKEWQRMVGIVNDLEESAHKFAKALLEAAYQARGELLDMNQEIRKFYTDKFRDDWGVTDWMEQLVKDRSTRDELLTKDYVVNLTTDTEAGDTYKGLDALFVALKNYEDTIENMEDSVDKISAENRHKIVEAEFHKAYIDYSKAAKEAWETEKKLVEVSEAQVRSVINMIKSLESLRESLKDTRTAIMESALNPDQSFGRIQSRYRELKTKAETTGDQGDIRAFASYASTYLEAAQRYYKSTDDYEAIFQEVAGVNGDLFNVEIELLQASTQLLEAVAGSGGLIEINDTLYNAATGQIAESTILRKAIEDLGGVTSGLYTSIDAYDTSLTNATMVVMALLQSTSDIQEAQLSSLVHAYADLSDSQREAIASVIGSSTSSMAGMLDSTTNLTNSQISAVLAIMSTVGDISASSLETIRQAFSDGTDVTNSTLQSIYSALNVSESLINQHIALIGSVGNTFGGVYTSLEKTAQDTFESMSRSQIDAIGSILGITDVSVGKILSHTGQVTADQINSIMLIADSQEAQLSSLVHAYADLSDSQREAIALVIGSSTSSMDDMLDSTTNLTDSQISAVLAIMSTVGDISASSLETIRQAFSDGTDVTNSTLQSIYSALNVSESLINQHIALIGSVGNTFSEVYTSLEKTAQDTFSLMSESQIDAIGSILGITEVSVGKILSHTGQVTADQINSIMLIADSQEAQLSSLVHVYADLSDSQREAIALVIGSSTSSMTDMLDSTTDLTDSQISAVLAIMSTVGDISDNSLATIRQAFSNGADVTDNTLQSIYSALNVSKELIDQHFETFGLTTNALTTFRDVYSSLEGEVINVFELMTEQQINAVGRILGQAGASVDSILSSTAELTDNQLRAIMAIVYATEHVGRDAINLIDGVLSESNVIAESSLGALYATLGVTSAQVTAQVAAVKALNDFFGVTDEVSMENLYQIGLISEVVENLSDGAVSTLAGLTTLSSGMTASQISAVRELAGILNDINVRTEGKMTTYTDTIIDHYKALELSSEELAEASRTYDTAVETATGAYRDAVDRATMDYLTALENLGDDLNGVGGLGEQFNTAISDASTAYNTALTTASTDYSTAMNGVKDSITGTDGLSEKIRTALGLASTNYDETVRAAATEYSRSVTGAAAGYVTGVANLTEGLTGVGGLGGQFNTAISNASTAYNTALTTASGNYITAIGSLNDILVGTNGLTNMIDASLNNMEDGIGVLLDQFNAKMIGPDGLSGEIDEIVGKSNYAFGLALTGLGNTLTGAGGLSDILSTALSTFQGEGSFISNVSSMSTNLSELETVTAEGTGKINSLITVIGGNNVSTSLIGRLNSLGVTISSSLITELENLRRQLLAAKNAYEAEAGRPINIGSTNVTIPDLVNQLDLSSTFNATATFTPNFEVDLANTINVTIDNVTVNTTSSSSGFLDSVIRNPLDPTKWELAEGGKISGPVSGYQLPGATFHGTEAIIPLKNDTFKAPVVIQGGEMSNDETNKLLRDLIEAVYRTETKIDGNELVKIIKKSADDNRVQADNQGMHGRRMVY